MKKMIPLAMTFGFCVAAINVYAEDNGKYHDATPSRVNLDYAGTESHADESINEESWWFEWDKMIEDQTITEYQNCFSALGLQELNQKQLALLNKGCAELVFLDTFDNEEGTSLVPGGNVQNIDGIVQLKKWNVTGAPGITVRRGSAPTVNDSTNPQSYAVILGQTTSTTGVGTAKIETKGPLTLTKGRYALSFKVKERAGSGTTAKFAGVKATVVGKYFNYAEKNHMIQTLPNNFKWSTAILEFTVNKASDDVYISLENIYNGKIDEPAIIDAVMLHKVSNEIG